MLRRHGIADAYEQLKELTRGHKITEKDIKKFIKGLDLAAEIKDEIIALTPTTYLGYAAELADKKI